MRQAFALLAGLAVMGIGACTSSSDFTSPSSLSGGSTTAAKGGSGGGRGGGNGGGPAATGNASATGAIAGSISDGAFDSGGNFSGSGELTFDLSQQLDLVTGGTFGDPAVCGGGSAGVTTTANFATLSGVGGGSLLDLTAGQTMIKSVRFSGLASTDSSPSSCGLHFRGDAILDGDTEMSRMLTTCDASDASGCTAWTMTPCTYVGQGGVCEADDVSGGQPVGQLYGQFSKRIGFQPMARYVMPWSMTIAKN